MPGNIGYSWRVSTHYQKLRHTSSNRKRIYFSLANIVHKQKYFLLLEWMETFQHFEVKLQFTHEVCLYYAKFAYFEAFFRWFLSWNAAYRIKEILKTSFFELNIYDTTNMLLDLIAVRFTVNLNIGRNNLGKTPWQPSMPIKHSSY